MITLRGLLFWLAIVLAVFISAEYWIVQSIYFNQNPEIYSLGVTFDLTLGIPAIIYFFLFRPKRYPILAMIPVFVISIWIATLMIPDSYQSFLTAEKRLIPFIELALLAYVLSRIPGFVKSYRRCSLSHYYFSDSIKAAISETISKHRLVDVLSTEFILVYLSFTGWFKKFNLQNKDHLAFPYYRKSGYPLIFGIMSFLLLVETVLFHVVLLHWSTIAAYIMTGLSIYSFLWMIGDFHAIRLHPVLITEDKLYIRTGLRWRADISINDILKLKLARGLREKPETMCVQAYSGHGWF